MKSAEEMTIDELYEVIDKKIAKQKPRPDKAGSLKKSLYSIYLEYAPIDYLNEVEETVSLPKYCFRDEASRQRQLIIDKLTKEYKKVVQHCVALEIEFRAGHKFERWKIKTADGKCKYRWYPKGICEGDDLYCSDGFSDHWAKNNLEYIISSKDIKKHEK